MFRYKLVVYHENQPWIPEVSRLLDLPFFHVFSTDSGILLQQQLDNQDVDVIVTNFQSRMMALIADQQHAFNMHEASIWKTIQDNGLYHKIVLLCSLQDVEIAADMVQQGLAADYVVIDPMIDHHRPLLTIMKVLENNSLRDLVSTHLMQNDTLPLHPVESLEILKTTHFERGSTETSALDPSPQAPMPPRTSPSDLGYANAIGSDFLSILDNDEDSGGLESLMQQLGTEPKGESAKLLARSVSMEPEIQSTPSGGKVLNPDEVFEIADEYNLNLPQEPTTNNRDVTRRGAWTNLQKSEEPILLVESPGNSIGQIINTLKRIHTKVRVVHSAQDALAALNKEMFELILINMDLPDQKGIQFVQRLRLKGPQSDINVIMLSDRARHEDVIKSVKVGADYFIIKPFDPDRFIKYLGQHIALPKK